MKIKNLISFLIILGVFGVVSQTVYAQVTSGSFNRINPNSQCDKSRLSPIKCGYYEEGFQDGVADARNNRENDYKRYRRKFEKQYESFYEDGYEKGFASIRGFSRWTNRQRNAYDRGYNFGEDDRDRRISRLPRRYEGRYDQAYEAYYRRGYLDGYNNRRKQYDVPIGRNENPRGNNRRRRGTATGTLIWNGRVDNRVQVILQGDDVQTKQIAGRLMGVYHNLQGVLPRRNATISVSKVDGRGIARVIQQPNRSNDYTAIVEIYDPKRSDDNYQLRINWQASRAQEQYSPGKLTWRGRVDATAEVRISGDFVESVDLNINGSGLTVYDSNLEGYLAARRGTVRVRKKDGRGTVTVVEQPSRRNDFTAVIRIFDPKGGDDEYELEVTW